MDLSISTPTLTKDYQLLKEEILAWCGLSPCQMAVTFHHWSYNPSLIPRSQLDALLCITMR